MCISNCGLKYGAIIKKSQLDCRGIPGSPKFGIFCSRPTRWRKWTKNHAPKSADQLHHSFKIW